MKILPRQMPTLEGLQLPGALIEAVRQAFQRIYDLRDSIQNIPVNGTVQKTQAELLGFSTTLGINNANLLVEVTDYRHILRWTGTGWEWGPEDPGVHPILFLPVDPNPTTGYQLCDGTTVDYLKSDGTTGSFATPDLTSAANKAAYLKFADTVAGPTAASSPTLTMDSYTPAGSISWSANNYTVVNGPTQLVNDITGFVGTPATLTGTVAADGEMRRYAARPWFRR